MRMFIQLYITLAIILSSPLGFAQHEGYIVVNDHINRPVMLLNPNDAAVAWEAQHKPFGESSVVVDELELGRHFGFPGQYFDGESGFYYNYYRDYDPSLGRYIQADPIGIMKDFSGPQIEVAIKQGIDLKGSAGLHDPFKLNHLYGYANQNPISETDLFGLRPIGDGDGPSPSTRCKLQCYDNWLISNAQSTIVCTGASLLVAPSGPGALAVHATCKTSTALGHFDLAKCLSQCPDDDDECKK